MSIQKRKGEHIDICLNEKVTSDHNYWNDVSLVYQALPEINRNQISTEINLFGKKLNYPIVIAAMSGGHDKGKIINENCAKAASELGIGLAVGSQRAALEDEKLTESYAVIKKYDVPLIIANIGAAQLITQGSKAPLTMEDIQKIMEMIDADVLEIHLNFPQEVIQPEGDESAEGILNKIKEISQKYSVIIKDCSFGISKETASKLKDAGIIGIEASGLSGTNWAAVEYHRAKNEGDTARQQLGALLLDWGLPSPISLLESKTSGLSVIANGGINNGLIIAKAIALGATATSMAGALLPNALAGSEKIQEQIERMISELKTIMFLTGSKDIEELKKVKYVLKGELKDWKEQREL
ncbi:MAG: type 2 isopentenyl-diphosphate Delta-isomerase [Patescibacteria group bacterium]